MESSLDMAGFVQMRNERSLPHKPMQAKRISRKRKVSAHGPKPSGVVLTYYDSFFCLRISIAFCYGSRASFRKREYAKKSFLCIKPSALNRSIACGIYKNTSKRVFNFTDF